MVERRFSFLKNIINSFWVVLGVSSLTFLLTHLLPGDPTELILGASATIEEKKQLALQLGLTDPLLKQYFLFLKNLLVFDLGESIHSNFPVAQLLLGRFPASAELTIGAMFLAVITAIPIGVISAIKKYSLFDILTSFLSLFSLSTPGFLLGPFLIWLLAIQWPLFPVSERGGWEHLVLPALSLALPLSSILIRVTRASFRDTLKEDYIRTARAKGLSEFFIYAKHGLRNAMGPIITTIGLQVGALLTGTIITETIFDWPGLGTLLVEAIYQRDYPVIQGAVLLIALIYIAVNLLTDVIHKQTIPIRE